MRPALHVPTETVEAVMPWLDLIYADLKLFDSREHETYVGTPNDRIKKHIRLLLESEKRDAVVIRTPMIPQDHGQKGKYRGDQPFYLRHLSGGSL